MKDLVIITKMFSVIERVTDLKYEQKWRYREKSKSRDNEMGNRTRMCKVVANHAKS